MHISLLTILACPSCRRSYQHHSHETRSGEILWGYLRCPSCAIVIPIAEGFAFFTEPLIQAELASEAALQRLATQWFGSEADYAAYCRQKSERGGHEPYAAFQPFNESTRAVDALMPWLSAHVPEDGWILDPWCRTGWSAEWLAGRFPRQRVIALWEGERSVLGYRGYRHWLGSGRRAGNLDILFVHPERGLPFRDDVFSLIYALDSFHRFSLHPFASECWRVAAPDGALALAHMHLSNSEPDPWFDRGCTIRHGLDYRAWLDRLLKQDKRRGWVFSEIDLFKTKLGAIPPDNPATEHYNGFVLIADPDKHDEEAAVKPVQLMAETRLLLNPIFRIFIGRDCLRVDPGLMNGTVGDLLSRHPAYCASLTSETVEIDERQLALLALAVLGQPLEDLAQSLACDLHTLRHLAAPLIAADILLPTNISKAGFDMQRFHAHQWPATVGGGLIPGFIQTLIGNLAENLAQPPSDFVIRNRAGDVLSSSDLPKLLDLLSQFLRGHGIGSGSRLAIGVTQHPLGLALTLAGMTVGCDIQLCRPGQNNAPTSRPDLLIHADDVTDEVTGANSQAGKALSLGLDGSANSLLGQIASLQQQDSTSLTIGAVETATISLWLGDRLLTFPLHRMLEAALSLMPAAVPDTGARHAPWSFAGFLSALIGLARRESVLFAG